MITREQLIEVWMDVTWEDTPEAFEWIIWNWLNVYYYSDVVEYLQYIIHKLKLNFRIEELNNYWTISYYEKWDKIIHIWDMKMEYESIDELLTELNTFESLVPNK